MTCVFFFFFQAEDGIRDLTVTGVQTCALPISPIRSTSWPPATTASGASTSRAPARCRRECTGIPAWRARAGGRTGGTRSEERRVGEECRSRWAADHLKKKKKIEEEEMK